MSLIGGALGEAAAARLDVSRLHRIDHYLERLIAERRAGCAAVDLYRRGQLAYSARISADGDLERETSFRWYSMTKPITAMALLTLYEEGVFGFDTPVAQFLPELGDPQVLEEDGSLRPAARPILMRDLFNHHAGFAYGINAEDEHPLERKYREIPVLDFTQPLETVLQRVAALPLSADPGAGYRYSISIDLLSLIAERVSGQSFTAFLQQRVLEPLGMQSAGFTAEPSTLPLLYNHDRSGCIRPARSGPIVYDAGTCRLQSGGGGLIGTIEDYARFGEAVLRGLRDRKGTILSPAVLRLATRPAFEIPSIPYWPIKGTIGSFHCYADPGLSGTPVPGSAVYAGGAAGTFCLIDPEHDLLAIGMTQVLNWSAGEPPSFALEPLIYQAIN